ncbi:hypothetical protein B0H14DRAFT_3445636 [Mycena olivaceomarginata]|nr:hypothetical protein B0H14DRAFT_3445636 [Mycena olivaceomarginata]
MKHEEDVDRAAWEVETAGRMDVDAAGYDANGGLLDASQIKWYNDVDDENLIPDPSSSSASTSAVPLHPIFSGVRPLVKVGGSRRSSPRRRSSRASKLSARVSDPNNAEAHISSGKRKAIDTAPHKPRKKSPETVDAETEGEITDAASAMDIDRDEYCTRSSRLWATQIMNTYNIFCNLFMLDCTVFRRVVEKDPQTGVITQPAGNICLVLHGLQTATCFLTGSVSRLRSHIARHDDHFRVYKARCQELNIDMHQRAIPNTDSSKETQGTRYFISSS